MLKSVSIDKNKGRLSDSTRRFVYFSALHTITLYSGNKKYYSYADGLKFTADRSIVKKLIPNYLRNTIGSLHYDDLFQNKVVAYSKENVSTTEDPFDYIQRKYDTLNWLFRASWLIKDNSMHIETSYLLEYRDGEFYTVHSTYHGNIYFCSGGRLKNTTLNPAEIKDILQAENFLLHSSKNSDKPNITYTSYQKESYRHFICLNHITNARQEKDLAMRITSFCSAFESILSTANTELAHQVAERCAVFLSATPEHRLLIYKNMKYAYSIRSKLVHGDSFKEREIEKLPSTSLFCEWALRMIFQRLLTSPQIFALFLGDNKDLEEYMKFLVLGSESLESIYEEIPSFLT